MTALEPSFTAGQAAFAQGDYPTAIAHLEAIAQTELDPKTRNQAYQTLIVAYYRSDRVRDALDLCKTLTQEPAVYPWAAKTLQDLTTRHRKAQAQAFQPPGEQGRRAAPKSDAEPQRPLPMVTPDQSEVAATVFVSGREWKNAERAQKWRPLKAPRWWKFWLRMVGTLVALFWVMRWGWQWSTAALKWLMLRIPTLSPPLWLDRDLTWPIAVLIGIALMISPWWLDLVLRWQHTVQKLPLYTLANQHPETAKVLQRLATQHQLPIPQLRTVATSAPWIITYGNWPRTARMVMSEALLAQLEDEELATIVASQFAQIVQRDSIFMSGAIALLQIPFLGYQLYAAAGETVRNFERWPSAIPGQLRQGIVSAIAHLCGWVAAGFYGIYWFWRLPLLYFSRQRVYYSDRFAAGFTGNPNALSRAILKVAIGLSRHLAQRQETLPILESFDLLMPVSHRQATLGSLPDKTPFSEVLVWDCTNPYRQWLALVNSHPLMGDRLYLLNRYANHWQLPPEVDLPTIVPPPRLLGDRVKKWRESYKALPILQSAVLAGLVFGIASRVVLWLVGILADGLSRWFSLWRLIWLHNAANPFLSGCILIAFSLSLIVWINGYFPDIRITPSREDPRIEDLLKNPKQVPPKSYPVRLQGKLMGRTGIANWLNQDLLLQTSSGLIKLHFFSKLGPLGNLFPWPKRPEQFIGQKVTVFGWFRRGSTPWIDVDVIRNKSGESTQSGYPVWVTILAIASALIGAYIIYQA